MTREETMEMLRHCGAENYCDDGIHGTCKGCNRRTALDIAIDALNDIEKWRTWSHTYDNACMDRERREDLISRAEAIEALQTPPISQRSMYQAGYRQAQEDRPRGEWVEQEDDYHHYWECSECGMGVGLDDIRNFCPNCGADMRSE